MGKGASFGPHGLTRREKIQRLNAAMLIERKDSVRASSEQVLCNQFQQLWIVLLAFSGSCVAALSQSLGRSSSVVRRDLC
jgi:hypothetical protein